jgi:hypothetical protein
MLARLRACETSNASPPPGVGFAAKTRLPTLFHVLADVGEDARLNRLRGLFTRARSGPRDVRRLLPSNTIRKHGRRTIETHVRSTTVFRRRLGIHGLWLGFQTPLREQSSSEARESSLLGSEVLFEQQGTRCLDALRARWLALEALPQSNPRSDTSCRAGHGCAAWRSLAGDRGAPTNPLMN